jgi:hypothetical protein
MFKKMCVESSNWREGSTENNLANFSVDAWKISCESSLSESRCRRVHADGKLGEDLLPEQLGPRSPKPFLAMEAESGLRVEHVAGFVVPAEDHRASLTF